jgi:hypothetical protein
MEISMSITDEELDERLGRAESRVAFDMPGPTIERMLSATRQQAKQRRKIRFGVVAGVVAFTIAGGVIAGPAAADAVRSFLAQSPWNPKAGGEVLKGSEWVDTGASDLPLYVDSIYETFLPLAPGQTRQSVVAEVSKSAAAAPGLTQEVGLRRSMERDVYVAWVCEWIAADNAHDQLRGTQATAAISEAPSWPAFMATDGGGIVKSMRIWSHRISQGDRDAAEEVAQIETLKCWDGVDRQRGIGVVVNEAQK